MTPSQKKLVVRFYLAFTVVTAVGLLGLIGAEAYIRWALNQNFTLLGSPSLIGVCGLVLGELWGAVYLLTHEK